MKINKIPIYKKDTLEVWSKGRLDRWKDRVQNHLDELIEKHKDEIGAIYDINRFKEYIKLMNDILKEDRKDNIQIDNINNDISG